MNDYDYFNEWFDTYGIRTYSRNHGTAEGHREYMAAAFLAGYHAHEKNIGKKLLDCVGDSQCKIGHEVTRE